jgi:23S rRNA (uracil1939-C5)-methyltransferase
MLFWVPRPDCFLARLPFKDRIGNLQFHISAQSFFQVNSEQAAKLYGEALKFANLQGKETVVDVYCGTGTITLFLAQKAKIAYGIEIVPEAIKDAQKNAALNKITNANFILGDAAYALPKLVQEGVRPDVIVLDPPRAGCEEKVLAAIASSEAETHRLCVLQSRHLGKGSGLFGGARI